jgi:DnaJ-domain-containing protein 1
MSILKRLQGIISAEMSSHLNSKEKKYSDREKRTDDQFSESQDFSKNDSPTSSNIEDEYFANLELSPEASFEEIKKSYKNLLKKYHPDKYHNDERSEYAEKITKKLNEAYSYFENKYKEKK